jgi:uncharacterized protein (TIGR03083 family)
VITAVFLGAAARVAPLLRAPELASRWTEPSALADFQNSGLAGHLARAVFNIERYLQAPVLAGVPMVDAVTYFGMASGPEVDRAVRDRGEQDAAGGPADLADRYDAARARLTGQLAYLPKDRPVLMFGHVLPLRECVLTRLVELVVHADDLAVSLGVPTPEVGEEAADLVVTTLGRISRRRHGTLPVLRALSRSERAPANVSAF